MEGEKVLIFGSMAHLLVDKKRADELRREFSFLRRYDPHPEDPVVRAVRRLGVKTW